MGLRGQPFSASVRYSVALLTPNVSAITGTGSPLARIRSASATLSGESLRGRPIGRPRAFRAALAAARRSRPSSNSNSASDASTPATMRPVALEVSMPSRSDRSTIPRSRRSRIVVITSAALRPEPVDADDHDGVAGPGVVEQRGQARPLLLGRRAGQLVAVDAGGSTPAAVRASVLLVEGLVAGADAGVAEKLAGGRDSLVVAVVMSVSYLKTRCETISIRDNFRDSGSVDMPPPAGARTPVPELTLRDSRKPQRKYRSREGDRRRGLAPTPLA